MVGIAWVLKSERRKFRMHGTVLHIDVVGDTNEEDRPIVTFTIRDRERRQITWELREKVLWMSSSVSQGTYLLLDLPYTCHRLSEDTAVLLVASSVLLLPGNT
jgi:hypothetical protein